MTAGYLEKKLSLQLRLTNDLYDYSQLPAKARQGRGSQTDS